MTYPHAALKVGRKIELNNQKSRDHKIIKLRKQF